MTQSPPRPGGPSPNWLAREAGHSGSHRILPHPDRPDFVFSFHDREEIGPRMLARIAKHTGLTPGDL